MSILYKIVLFATLQVILSLCQKLGHYSPLHFVEHTEQPLGTTETKEQDQLGYYKDHQKRRA